MDLHVQIIRRPIDELFDRSTDFWLIHNWRRLKLHYNAFPEEISINLVWICLLFCLDNQYHCVRITYICTTSWKNFLTHSFHIFFFLCPIFKRSMSSVQEMQAYSTVCILSSIITEEIIFKYWHLYIMK